MNGSNGYQKKPIPVVAMVAFAAVVATMGFFGDRTLANVPASRSAARPPAATSGAGSFATAPAAAPPVQNRVKAGPPKALVA